jgi:hypothetical protein
MGQLVPLQRGTSICSWCTRWTRWGCTRGIQLTHSLKAPGFNPLTLNVISWFQAFAFKCSLYRYNKDGPGDDGDFLLNEKTFASWTEFLKRTSEDLFTGSAAPGGGGGGRMTCDCWRDEPGGRGDLGNSRVAEYKENRYYFKRREGRKNIALSFYWWPGDLPLQGSYDAGSECNAMLVPDTQPPPGWGCTPS